MPITPLSEIPIVPQIATLPKVDLHIHQEWSMRLDRVLARRAGTPPFDWRGWAQQLMHEKSPGAPRLAHISSIHPAAPDLDAIDENVLARLVDLFAEAAADGAVLVEVRCGKETILRPNFMALFREAEQQVQTYYPHFHAAPIVTLLLWLDPERVERMVQACISAAKEGIYGVDLLYQPYATEADWRTIYPIAERLASAGLGITIHVGEVSTANLAAALRTPGVTRLGHATHAVYDPELLHLLAQSQMTVECSLSCNVILGAAPSYEEHPIRQFVAAGIPVAICTDDPVQICTTIGREYAIAHALEFTPAELLAITRHAVEVAFISPEAHGRLLAQLGSYQ